MGYLNLILTILITMVSTQLITGDEALSSLVIAPHCSSMCGNITIPYPFGIEEGCYYVDNYMGLKCDRSGNPPQLILGKNILVSNIDLTEGEIRVNQNMSFNCYSQGESQGEHSPGVNLVAFTISSTKNKLVATGCDTYAWFTGFRHGMQYETGCMTKCDSLNSVADNNCNGVGCCEASIPDGISNITTKVSSFSNHTSVAFNPCSVAFPVANDSFTFLRKNLTQGLGFYSDFPLLPVIFNWGIGRQRCSEAQEQGSCLCKNNTICSDLEPDQVGYRCKCKDGFTGNPYLPQGCQDIDECKGANECEKTKYCTNTNGSYICECPKGYHGNGTRTDRCVSSSKAWLTPVIITAGIGGSIIILLVVGFLLHWRNGERRIKNLRESFFHQNGGLILHQKLSRMDTLKIFTAQDLENATDKYNEINIIGRGGYGIVYKGIIENNQQVAIKRSLKVDPGQVEQFINEILILSQINNRNIVRLLGCCLETEVPLLVYEYINNGTLYDHLNDEAKVPLFTWNIRLGIATEVAEVLAYLHTTITTPIIHRDMKSMNILLDECYTAKVADFGGSRLVPVDQGQLATMVLGTLGYLDPEYMQTSELTEKSDVYSFGVVLVELLTRKKALSYQRPEIERCLAMHFLLKMKEDRLFDIIDKNIANSQGDIEQIKKVATLAKWCLFLKGEDRPTMKEVAMELEGIKRMNKHPWQDLKSSLDQENDCEYLLLGIPKDDGGNSGGNSGRDSSFISSLGGGR
ncbi:putative wall-associated receptor kinase-like 16 [Silene latifolia]|uniref:putative wall-associated receptor kinase-like 16 n=1 Tax=Silene latifolia TaxID=37657 RepID=UPI003D77CB03